MAQPNYPVLRLKRGKEESLVRFDPWVFSGALADGTIPESLEEGDVVAVQTSDGRAIGVGHFQIGSIAVRILDFGLTDISADFYRSRLEQALALRKSLQLARPDNDAYRLVHGEGDFLPGLVVDVYGPTAVLQAHSPGMHYARQTIAEQIASLPGLGVRNVYYKSETTLPYKAHLDPQNTYLVGEFETSVASENSLKFNIDWLRGQKTGFFLDQRDNRSLLRHYSRGRRVLNMFCYTGGFSVYALSGGAVAVDSVDSSEKAITLTDANVALNFGECPRHRSFARDAFKFLDDMAADAYDLIVLEHPAFSKHRSALRNALRVLQKLND